jgi:hypothetical protein
MANAIEKHQYQFWKDYFFQLRMQRKYFAEEILGLRGKILGYNERIIIQWLKVYQKVIL